MNYTELKLPYNYKIKIGLYLRNKVSDYFKLSQTELCSAKHFAQPYADFIRSAPIVGFRLFRDDDNTIYLDSICTGVHKFYIIIKNNIVNIEYNNARLLSYSDKTYFCDKVKYNLLSFADIYLNNHFLKLFEMCQPGKDEKLDGSNSPDSHNRPKAAIRRC